jgi:HEAT repeat protein
MRFGLIVSLLLSTQISATTLVQSPQGFIAVAGTDLKSRLAAARELGAARGRFWAAYSFPVRPGITFDATYLETRGSVMVIDGAAAGARPGSRNVGVFLLYENAGVAPARVEIYNLARPRDYAGLPVYWLGPAAADQSLAVLRGLVNDVQSHEPAGRLVDAIGAHDVPDGAAVLQDIIRTSKTEGARTAAVSWLRYWPGQTPFLAALVRDGREHTPVRREAAESLSGAVDGDVLPLLQELYRTVPDRDIKGELLEGIADERFEASGTAFLIEIASREPDGQLRREALESLGERSGKDSLQALEKAAFDSSVPLDLQNAAVEAIRERPEAEGVPLLKKIVESHPRIDVRRAAVEELADLPGQLPFLTSLAGNAKHSVDLRRAAIEAIADAETGDAVTTLQKLFASVSSRDLKQEIIEAIADSQDRAAAIRWLAGIARDDADGEVRAEAVSALGDMEDERAVEALGQLYDSTRIEGTRREILDALGEAGGAAALQKMIAVARSDPSMALRKRAIELLGDSDDPAAQDFLERLLK